LIVYRRHASKDRFILLQLKRADRQVI
jgi:hypothetical protein